MVEVVKRQRKSPILTPSSIPCLQQLPTINITQGCALGCTYCYIQGYPGYPGPERVVLFENTATLVQEELNRKRRLPRRVYFSSSSDPFQFLPGVQEVTFQTMSVLLGAGVEVSFLTKGFVGDRFIRLFAKTPKRVFAQVGITTLNSELWKRFEPRTAPPQRRIELLRSLGDIGVQATARLDPLIPAVTDREENIGPLFECLGAANIRHAAASYLFLRPPFDTNVRDQLRSLGPADREPLRWQHQRFAEGCGGGRMIDNAERTTRFACLVELGEHFGIRLTPCRCKNPELGDTACQIAGPLTRTANARDSQQILDFVRQSRAD